MSEISRNLSQPTYSTGTRSAPENLRWVKIWCTSFLMFILWIAFFCCWKVTGLEMWFCQKRLIHSLLGSDRRLTSVTVWLLDVKYDGVQLLSYVIPWINVTFVGNFGILRFISVLKTDLPSWSPSSLIPHYYDFASPTSALACYGSTMKVFCLTKSKFRRNIKKAHGIPNELSLGPYVPTRFNFYFTFLERHYISTRIFRQQSPLQFPCLA